MIMRDHSRALVLLTGALALALAVSVGASRAGADERGTATLDTWGEISLVYMPQIAKCMIIYDGFKAGGATEVECTDDFRQIAKTVRFPDPSE